MFSINKVTLAKTTEPVIAHRACAETGIEQTPAGSGSGVTGRIQLLEPRWWGFGEQDESVGKAGDVTHLACRLASQGLPDE